MNRLFLDANVLFSAAYRADSRLLALWKLKNVVLCSSRYALEEARINLDDEGQRRRLLGLSSDLQLFEAADHKLPREISLPEKDVPILLAAITAEANYLLTGDIRHFGRLMASLDKAGNYDLGFFPLRHLVQSRPVRTILRALAALLTHRFAHAESRGRHRAGRRLGRLHLVRAKSADR